MTHAEIKQALLTGCSEEDLVEIRCPVCDGKTSLHVHPRRNMFSNYLRTCYFVSRL